MSAVFLKLLNMSITASYFALGVMALRLVLKKAPKWITVLLWGLVGLRLLLPFSIESKQSLIPNTEPITPGHLSYTPNLEQVQPTFIPPIETESPVLLSPTGSVFVPPTRDYTAIAANIWILGMILMLCYFCFSYLLLHRKLREAVPLEKNLWLCDHIPSPFLLGFFRPRIYLPSDLAAEDLSYVIAHEEAHLKRKDHWWKPLAFLLLTVYWFNPILWIAYILLCNDIEFACDEKVMKSMGTVAKKPYSEALLRCSQPKLRLSACPLAFGESSVKKRISSVLSYKKPAFWIIAASLVLSIGISVSFLTDPAPSYEVCWFDFLAGDHQEEFRKSIQSQEVPGHPEFRLKLVSNRLSVVKDGKEQYPFPNRYIFNAFFADLNQDGSPELCCSGFTYGEGYLRTDASAYVYDFATEKRHDASDELPFGHYHFTLVDGSVTLCRSQYSSNAVSSDFNTQLNDNLTLIREAASVTYGEPLLCMDSRIEGETLAWKLQDKLYPFYLSWDGKLLRNMDDKELTAFLSKSIPEASLISAPQLESARFVIDDVEKDPTAPFHYVNTDRSWELKVLRAAAEYYGCPLQSSMPFGNEPLTLPQVLELSHKGESLIWEDLLPYKATDVGSGLYIMEYPINERYTLRCTDGKLTGSPMRALLIDRQTGLSIDIRRDLVEGFLNTPTYKKWFDSSDATEALTAKHPTIPDLQFNFDRSKAMLSFTENGKFTDLTQINGILNAYFADVTLDGVADLCCSYMAGYGVTTSGIVYHDPVNKITHYISDTLGYQYALVENHDSLQIRVTTDYFSDKTEYYDLRSIASGNLPSPMELGALMESYPHFFTLDTQHGLILYVSEYKGGAFACRLISHPGTPKLPEIDLSQLTPCNSSEMLRILYTYRRFDTPIDLVPVETAYSALAYSTPEEYAETLRKLFTPLIPNSAPMGA